MSKITLEPGTCWPNEYDWEMQFAEALNGKTKSVRLDSGKVRGLALAYIQAQADIAAMASERSDMLKIVAQALVAQNAKVANK